MFASTPKAFHCQSPGFGGLLPPNPGFTAPARANPERVAPAGQEQDGMLAHRSPNQINEIDADEWNSFRVPRAMTRLTQGFAAKGRETLGCDGATPSAEALKFAARRRDD